MGNRPALERDRQLPASSWVGCLFFSVENGTFEPDLIKLSNVLIRTIAHYLTSHKRIVVPQLGTFLVKEPGGGVLFSELLRRDDGVLRGLLREEGMGEVEAAGEIDRLVFEIRHAVERSEEYPLEGFGVMKPGANGTISFVHKPPVAEPARIAGADSAAQPEGGPGAGKHLSAQPGAASGRVQPVVDAPRVSPSAKMNPDPSVRGLRYGKPPRNTDAYTYVDRAPRRRPDRFIWFAVLAAVLALTAIAYGYIREEHKKRMQTESFFPTTPQTTDQTTADKP